jgi:hypothetical protein
LNDKDAMAPFQECLSMIPLTSTVEFPEGNPIQLGQSHPEKASSAFRFFRAML